MLENNVYNLMRQITEESKSLWSIRNEYKKDAENWTDLSSFWEEMEQQKEENIRRLEEFIRGRLISPDMPKGRASPYEP